MQEYVEICEWKLSRGFWLKVNGQEDEHENLSAAWKSPHGEQRSCCCTSASHFGLIFTLIIFSLLLRWLD